MTSFCNNTDEMLLELKSCLHQLVLGKTGFIIHSFHLKSQGPSIMLNEDLLYVYTPCAFGRRAITKLKEVMALSPESWGFLRFPGQDFKLSLVVLLLKIDNSHIYYLLFAQDFQN